tara:strand:- start:402 stop:860 length:459 start_codon:yes stop_codon:yes gene_type:complete
MISIHVDDDDALARLKTVYANRLNAASRGARYSMNARKQKFMRTFTECAKVEGVVVPGDRVVAVYHFVLPRCDWDAPVKAVQDACECYLECGNDRAIKAALTFLTRPKKGTKKRPGRKASVSVYLFNMDTELEQAMDKAKEIGQWSNSCWLS